MIPQTFQVKIAQDGIALPCIARSVMDESPVLIIVDALFTGLNPQDFGLTEFPPRSDDPRAVQFLEVRPMYFHKLPDPVISRMSSSVLDFSVNLYIPVLVNLLLNNTLTEGFTNSPIAKKINVTQLAHVSGLMLMTLAGHLGRKDIVTQLAKNAGITITPTANVTDMVQEVLGNVHFNPSISPNIAQSLLLTLLQRNQYPAHKELFAKTAAILINTINLPKEFCIQHFILANPNPREVNMEKQINEVYEYVAREKASAVAGSTSRDDSKAAEASHVDALTPPANDISCDTVVRAEGSVDQLQAAEVSHGDGLTSSANDISCDSAVSAEGSVDQLQVSAASHVDALTSGIRRRTVVPAQGLADPSEESAASHVVREQRRRCPCNILTRWFGR